MPRRMRSLHPAPAPRAAITASAAVVNHQKAPKVYASSEEWQKECYRHYRICGEARFAATFFGHALSKANLYVASDPYDLRSEPLATGPQVDALNHLWAASDGQPAILNACGIHLTIAGECYLVGRKIAATEDTEESERWEIRSVMEVKSNGVTGTGAQWWIDQPGMTPARLDLGEDDTVIRIWIPDPANAGQPDSPFRSLLPILEEIEWLTRYVFAQCSQRLAGAGLVVFPEEIDFPPPPDAPEGEVERTKVDNLMAYLADGMMTPIADPGDVRAKVPMAMIAPGDSIDKIKWLTFWSELDSEAKGLREEAIQRFALGMDLPPERILGMSGGGTGGGSTNGMSHWGAWQVDEDTIKMHVEPMLDVVGGGIGREYLREVSGDPEATVRYDTTALRLRPDRSKESIELYNLGLVKGSVVVKENGFDPDTEMMDDTERRGWLISKVAVGSATPEMVAGALTLLGVELPMPPPMPELSPSETPNEARPDPSIDEHPNRDLPERAALMAACDALVFRALERAGNRIRQVIRDAGGTAPQANSYEVHTIAPAPAKSAGRLLTDAWACAPQVLAGVDADPAEVLPRLEGYTISLLTSGQPHTRAGMERYLESQL